MSFAKDVKEELAKVISAARHCRIAELAGILSFGGKSCSKSAGNRLLFQTEQEALAIKYLLLLKKTFAMEAGHELQPMKQKKSSQIHQVAINEAKAAAFVLQAIKAEDSHQGIFVNHIVMQKNCCKRAFIRGAFLAAGFINHPEKPYHFEIAAPYLDQAEQLKELLLSFDLDAKIVKRKSNNIVYVKEGSQIVDLLNVMEAHVSLMKLENERILKEMRNSINRRVNCEAANINKTVVASTKQIEDILYIRDQAGFGYLTEPLEKTAMLRLEFPEASLQELGGMLTPPIGRSGVNHRLKKLSAIAENMRSLKEGKL